jgi:hypothetical protein
MAIIRTTDKRKVEVEVGATKAGEEARKVAAGPIPMVELKLAGTSEMVWVNSTQIVSIEESA